jgi:hypothetical protein
MSCCVSSPFVVDGVCVCVFGPPENYELIKNSQAPGAPEREAIALVAAQWTSISSEEKLAWKFRAEELINAGLLPLRGAMAAAAAADQFRGGLKKKGGRKEMDS